MVFYYLYVLQTRLVRHHIYEQILFPFFNDLINNLIHIPLFKKANSLILFSIIEELNFVEEKTSFEGKKFIFVPLFFVLPICFNGFTVFPFLKEIKYSLPSL